MRFLTLFLALALSVPVEAASLFAITPPFKTYPDTSGQPLNSGFLYFGTAGQNPETNPITVFWDVAGLIPAAQPIRTVNGYPARFGTPTNVYTSVDCSITVRNSKGALVVTAPNSTDLQLGGAILAQVGASAIAIADAGGFYQVPKNVENALQQAAKAVTITVTDAGGFFSSPKNVENCLQQQVTLARLVAAVQQALLPTGAVLDFAGTTAPAGFVLGSGRTIGDGSSGALERANADTLALFTIWWNATSNTDVVIQDSAGTPTTRGVDATTDFNLHKRLPLPDLRGRVAVGKDNMGGNTAGRIIVADGNFDATIQGKSGGSDAQTLTTAQIPAHSHAVTDPGHTHATTDPGHVHATVLDGSLANVAQTSGSSVRNILSNGGNGATLSNVTGVSVNSNTTGISTQNAGSGGSHPNVQPSIVLSKIIKLIVPLDFTGAN